MNYEDRWLRWLERADASLQDELRAMKDDPAAMEDAFYRDLAFGTGGLRGVIGAGSNRMNLHTVARASQGLANHVLKHFGPERRRIAISYDSRILSEEFARAAAGVFAANGIRVMIYPRLMPTPCLSWAVRALECAAGVMVTASHNPAKYNGYKVYGPDGCQITTQAAAEILGEIEALDEFDGPVRMDFDAGLDGGQIAWIPEDVLTAFIEAVKKESLLAGGEGDKSARIVYSPLNGTGLEPVTRILRECGYESVTVVAEQAEPDGRFPTCPYPNRRSGRPCSWGWSTPNGWTRTCCWPPTRTATAAASPSGTGRAATGCCPATRPACCCWTTSASDASRRKPCPKGR